jgi:membrane protein YqaA with SNARE-associated domain
VNKQQAGKIVKSKYFKRISLGLGVLFIILTYVISVTPQAFLRYGYFGVFVFNIISSGLLLFPILVGKFNVLLTILVSALGNIPNTTVNYLVGNTSNHLFSKNTIIVTLKHWMERFGLIVVYILAVIPLPIDLNGLLSGYVGIPYKKYILVNFLGKLTVFTLVALGVISVAKFMGK